LENLVELRKSLFANILKNRRLFRLIFLRKKVRAKYLTKYIVKFTKQNYGSKIKSFFLVINSIVSASPFCLSDKDANFLIKTGFIFINYRPSYSIYYTLKQCDIVEFFFTKKYVFFLKKYNVIFNKNLIFFRKKKIKLKITQSTKNKYNFNYYRVGYPNF